MTIPLSFSQLLKGTRAKVSRLPPLGMANLGVKSINILILFGRQEFLSIFYQGIEVYLVKGICFSAMLEKFENRNQIVCPAKGAGKKPESVTFPSFMGDIEIKNMLNGQLDISFVYFRENPERGYFPEFDGNNAVAVIALGSIVTVFTDKNNTLIIPKNTFQIFTAINAKMLIVAHAISQSPTMVICFPIRLLRIVNRDYFRISQFLENWRRGQNSTLFRFPRIIPRVFVAQVENYISEERFDLFSESYFGSFLYSNFLAELGSSNHEAIIKHFRGFGDQDEDKIFAAAWAILRDPSMRLSSGNIAGEIHVNDTWLKKKFKKMFSLSIHQFQEQIRMEKAMAMLEEENKSVLEISYELGYGSLSYFSKGFKKYTGDNPTDFRKKNYWICL